MYSARSAPLAISHRGLHRTAPENSLPAFIAALEAGAEGIELDVFASADETLFVHHDGTLEIDGKVMPFSAIDAADIQRARLAGRRCRSPRLDDTLAAIGDRADVFIEVKASGIENSVARCLRRHMSNSERHAVHAFDHRVIKRIVELVPSVRAGILQVSYLLDSCGAMRRAGATDLWQHADFIDASLVNDVHSCRGRIVAWTPNTETRWKELEALGVDGICTDNVDTYVAAVTGWR